MGSVYKPKDKNHLYISYKNPQTGKYEKKSTRLTDTKENRKKAQEILNKINEAIEKQKVVYDQAGVESATIEQAFLHFLELNNDKHYTTIKGYEKFYERFTDYFNNSNQCSVITKISVEKWLMQIKKFKLQQNSLNGIYKILNKFLQFLFEYYLPQSFKINKNVIPRAEVKEIITFEKSDLKLILGKLESKVPQFQRMVYLLLYTGLRPSDIINIRIEDVDFENQIIKYYSIKSKKYCQIPVYYKLFPLLLEWKESVTGRIIGYASYGAMSREFRKYLRKLKLGDKNYILRTFRKTFATKLYEQGLDTKTIATIMDHSNQATTMKYYTKAEIKVTAPRLNSVDL